MADLPPGTQGQGRRPHPATAEQGDFFFREKVVFWLRFSTLIFGASSDTKIGPLQRNSLRFVDSAAGLVLVPKKLPKNVRLARLFLSEKVVPKMLSGMALKSRGDCCFFGFASAPLLPGVVHVEMESVPAFIDS